MGSVGISDNAAGVVQKDRTEVWTRTFFLRNFCPNLTSVIYSIIKKQAKIYWKKGPYRRKIVFATQKNWGEDFSNELTKNSCAPRDAVMCLLLQSGLLQLSHGCSHCKFVPDMWRAPSFAFLTKSQESSRESLFELLSPCDMSPAGLNLLGHWYDTQGTPLRDKDRLRNVPQWFPSFLSCCSCMIPEQLRKKSELVDS